MRGFWDRRRRVGVLEGLWGGGFREGWLQGGLLGGFGGGVYRHAKPHHKAYPNLCNELLHPYKPSGLG